ncbi:MAG: alpha/beta fold hydrolase [Gemmobacter sp.]
MMPKTLRLSDGAAVRALVAGEGPPVVLIHGVGLRAEAWAPQIAALAADHRVIAVDMPGHGESDPLPEGARLPDYVSWAARVVAALDLGPVSLAGHSMGAMIAAGVAVERPDLLARVALLNGVHRRTAEARAAVIARAGQIAQGEGSIDGPLARWFGPEDAALRAQVAGWLQAVSLHGYAAAYRAFAEGDGVYADRLHQIRCPALVLTGEGDGNSTPAMAQAMADAMALGQAQVIAGHRHMMNLTAPAAVNAALRHWLTREELPA